MNTHKPSTCATNDQVKEDASLAPGTVPFPLHAMLSFIISAYRTHQVQCRNAVKYFELDINEAYFMHLVSCIFWSMFCYNMNSHSYRCIPLWLIYFYYIVSRISMYHSVFILSVTDRWFKLLPICLLVTRMLWIFLFRSYSAFVCMWKNNHKNILQLLFKLFSIFHCQDIQPKSCKLNLFFWHLCI